MTEVRTAVVVQLHAETVQRVEVRDLGAHGVSLVFGDDRSGVRLIGQGADVHQLIIEADRQLTRLAEGG